MSVLHGCIQSVLASCIRKVLYTTSEVNLYSFSSTGTIDAGSTLLETANGFDYSGGDGDLNRCFVDLPQSGTISVSLTLTTPAANSVAVFFRDGVGGSGTIIDTWVFPAGTTETISRNVYGDVSTILFDGYTDAVSYSVDAISITPYQFTTLAGELTTQDIYTIDSSAAFSWSALESGVLEEGKEYLYEITILEAPDGGKGRLRHLQPFAEESYLAEGESDTGIGVSSYTGGLAFQPTMPGEYKVAVSVFPVAAVSPDFSSLNYSLNSATDIDTFYETHYPNGPDIVTNESNGALAFGGNEFLLIFRRMYQLTGDTKWITYAFDYMTVIWNNTDQARQSRGEIEIGVTHTYYQAPSTHMANGTPAFGWSRTKSAGVYTCSLLDTSQIAGAMSWVCDLVKDSPELSAFHTQADSNLTLCEMAIAEHEAEWVNDKAFTDYGLNTTVEGGYYWQNPNYAGTVLYSTVMPFNQWMGAAMCMMVLDKHGITSAYMDKVSRLFTFFRRDLCRSTTTNINGDDMWLWNYSIDENEAARGAEDVNHLEIYGAMVFEFMFDNSYEGMDEDELVKYLHAIANTKIGETGVAEQIDGSGDITGTAYVFYLGVCAWLNKFASDTSIAEWMGAATDAQFALGSTSEVCIRSYVELVYLRDGPAV